MDRIELKDWWRIYVLWKQNRARSTFVYWDGETWWEILPGLKMKVLPVQWIIDARALEVGDEYFYVEGGGTYYLFVQREIANW